MVDSLRKALAVEEYLVDSHIQGTERWRTQLLPQHLHNDLHIYPMHPSHP